MAESHRLLVFLQNAQVLSAIINRRLDTLTPQVTGHIASQYYAARAPGILVKSAEFNDQIAFPFGSPHPIDPNSK